MDRAVWSGAVLFFMVGFHSAAEEFCGLKCDPMKKVDSQIGYYGKFIQPEFAALCGNKANFAVMAETPLAGGARRAMALAYGSCEVLKLPVRSRLNPSRITGSFKSISNGTEHAYDGVAIPSGIKQVRETHPYLIPLQKAGCTNAAECSTVGLKGAVPGVNPACKKMICDAYNSPPMYQYGGKAAEGEAVYHGVFTRKSYSSATKKTTVSTYAVSGVDCSFFIYQAMNRAGLNYSPGKPNRYQTTNGLALLGSRNAKGERLDCFDRVKSEGGIRPGDLLVSSGAHVVMVDTVGTDPFGIAEMIEGESAWDWQADLPQKTFEEIRKGTSKLDPPGRLSYLNKLATRLCTDEIDPARFKISIMHSSPNGNGVGIQRESSYSETGYGVGLGHSSSLLTLLKIKAKAECIGVLKEKWDAFAPGFKGLSNPTLEAIMKSEALSGGTKVLRHASNEPGCRASPPFDPAMSCADCCDLNSSYDGMTGGANAKN